MNIPPRRILWDSSESIDCFLRRVSQFEQVDATRIKSLVDSELKFIKAGFTGEIWRPLEQVWYRSVAAGQPDYNIYAHPDYLAEVWVCWVTYSRKYLKELCRPRPCLGGSVVDLIGDVVRVADLGCGPGYTTALIKQMFPAAAVIGTNFPGSTQYKVAESVGKLAGFSMTDQVEKLGHVDVVFASEYFEHIEKPVKHLCAVIDRNPRFIITANAFSAKCTGHFPEYSVHGKMLDGRSTSKEFNKTLRRQGYELVKAGIWNNRPAVWKKI